MQYDEIVIITGASKGLGRKILDQIIKKPNTLTVSISRSKIVCEADNFKQLNYDLSNYQNCKEALLSIENLLNYQSKIKKIILINNAARLGEIKTCRNSNPEDISKTIFLNTTVPILFQNKVVQCANKNVFVEVLNIISGASNKPYHGWGAYCTSKAGLLMATKTIALEITNLGLNAKVWALIPGVIDTEMQEKIRSSNYEDFNDLDRFIKFKSDNVLISPTKLACFISNSLNDKAFINGETYNVKEFSL
jgi:benzil reductase ((S)-benzoin forming)